jgi:deoxyribodipyrimidine photo-lyase
MQGHSFESLETLVDSQTNLFWFRRDLRLEDNAGLYDALQAGNVLCTFIFDTGILHQLEVNMTGALSLFITNSIY